MAAIDTPDVIKLLREFGQRVALRGGNPSATDFVRCVSRSRPFLRQGRVQQAVGWLQSVKGGLPVFAATRRADCGGNPTAEVIGSTSSTHDPNPNPAAKDTGMERRGAEVGTDTSTHNPTGKKD
jgi:hypothetical protein